jgi:hypothetical protein
MRVRWTRAALLALYATARAPKLTAIMSRSISGVAVSASPDGTRRWRSPARQGPDLASNPVDEPRRRGGCWLANHRNQVTAAHLDGR